MQRIRNKNQSKISLISDFHSLFRPEDIKSSHRIQHEYYEAIGGEEDLMEVTPNIGDQSSDTPKPVPVIPEKKSPFKWRGIVQVCLHRSFSDSSGCAKNRSRKRIVNRINGTKENEFLSSIFGI